MVLRLTPRQQPLVETDHHTLERVVKSLFQFRRKFIRRGARYYVVYKPWFVGLFHSLYDPKPKSEEVCRARGLSVASLSARSKAEDLVHVENVVSLFSSPSTSSQKKTVAAINLPNTCDHCFSGVAQVCRDAAGK